MCVLALLATGCPRQIGDPDAGPGRTDAGALEAGVSDAGPPRDSGYDPVLGNPFTGPLSFDDDRVARIDGTLLPSGSSPCREPILGRIYRVIDGDTVRFTSSDGTLDRSIRMIGVDTPEVGRDGMVSECYADEATLFTGQLLDRTVWLTFDATCFDSFDRLLAYVHIGAGSGDFWERQLLRRGFATELTVGANRQFRSVFQEDENTAMADNAGLWDACF